MTYDTIVSVLMVDPAVGYLPGQGYEAYDHGTQLDVWLKTPNGSVSLGVVWPGAFYPMWRRKSTLKTFLQASPFTPVRMFYMETGVHAFNYAHLDWFHPNISE